MKRLIVVLSLVLALSLALVGSAYANFGPHGGYIDDTDSCAGCHRAHTSFSEVTFRPRVTPPGWDDADNPSALLVGSSQTMLEFCNACHGDGAPGASTNVAAGTFDSGPSSSGSAPIGSNNGGVTTAYVTASTFGAPLNGGGFTEAASIVDWETDALTAYGVTTSTHNMEAVGVLWGDGVAATATMDLTCTSCHDPHGSSNYRLLKDSVNGNAVGGYFDDGTPNGMVFSVEENYPYADGGWLKHAPGQAQMAAYVPNYTSGSSQIRAGILGNSMSAWCAGCHEQYDEQSGTYNYGLNEAGGLVGAATRHRHPVDVGLGGDPSDVLQVTPQADGNLDRKIPLEINPDTADVRQGHIGCLTCHYAHGSNAQMSGWAAATLQNNGAGQIVPVRNGVPGVDPTNNNTSSLLRADNRGVCERCHDK